MKRFYIETFGCQMNVHDSEKVIGTLEQRGYVQVHTPEEADLVLYNTCSIRDKAEQKVFQRLNENRKAKGKIFGVLGCVAQQEGERIFEKAPHVRLVVGSASYPRLGELLVQIEQGTDRVAGLSLDTDATFETPVTRRDNPYRAYITIIEGCDKDCAYCVVPRTRGRERSRRWESVLEEARTLAGMGYTEIQLLGQNVNSYRDPGDPSRTFAPLLEAVAQIEGIRRVRFTTSHPRDFGRDIVDVINRNETVCNMVHLPVQSGSTKVLEAMQRQYTRDDYMRRIEWLKASPRDISLSTDIIVGFPGETEEDFEQTLRLLEEVEYDQVFSFKYSVRPNTPAERMGDQIPEQEKSRRLTVLQEKQRGIQLRRNTAMIGRVLEVLVEGYNSSTGQWIGRTTQNRVLNFVTRPREDGRMPAKEELFGRYLPVRVTRAGPNSLAGECAIAV
ncbi:MAG: tRNA (N6-isopentenyl adenosine(37)-C2)-methylthiotransferase MiaB [Bryobacteraceae bacterium]